MKLKSVILSAVLALGLTGTVFAGTDILAASAVRTTTLTLADVNKTTERGAHFVMVISYASAVPATDTITMKVQGKDAFDNYYDIISAAAKDAVGTVVLKVGQGIASVTNVAIGDILPDTYRVVVTNAGTGQFSYVITRNTAQ